MPDLGLNVVLHIYDDGDALVMRSWEWLNRLAGTQAGEDFTCISFPNFVFGCSLCSPTRGDLLTGENFDRHGITRHGNAPQDGTADPGAATRFVAAGTPGAFFNNWPKPSQITQWMHQKNRCVYYAGKWLNNNGWGTDVRQPKGIDRPFIILDDSDLGFAHALHVGSLYLGGASGGPAGRGNMFFLTDADGTLESHTGGSDPYTHVGYTATAYAGRVGATDYVTDLLNRKFRQWLDGSSGPRMSEPFFAVQSHRAAHAAWLPAARHAASTIYVNGGTGTMVATDGSTDPAGFNAEPLGVWDQADKAPLSGAAQIQARNDRIQKARCGLAFEEAVYDAWQGAKAGGNRKTVHIIISDNGFALGQNQDAAGKVSPYAASAVAPMYVLWPYGTGRRTETTLVQPVDIPALLCAMAGMAPSVAGDGMGAELLRVIDGTWPTGTAIRTHARFGFEASNEFIQPSFRGIQDASGKKVWRVGPYTDLTKGSTVFPAEVIATDTATDPGETANVVSSASWVPGLLGRMDGVAPGPTGTSILDLPRIPWEGGPTYWSAWANPTASGWTDPGFFPIGLHQLKPDDAAELAAMGINVAIEVQHDGNPISVTTAAGIDVLAHYEWTEAELLGNTGVVAYTVGDECDMGGCGGDGEVEVLDVFATAADDYRARADGRFVFANFSKGILRTYWMTTLMADMVRAVDAACADNYAYTSSVVQGRILEAPLWPAGANPISAAAYGWLTDQLRSFWASGAQRPTWTFVETKRPLLAEEEDVPITPDQLEGAVWACIIHEARGIAYFQHNDSGCGIYSLIDCGAEPAGRVTAVNAKIATLAPVINTQSYVYNFANGTDTMLKVHGGFAYIFAGIGLLQSPGSKTFTLPPGVTGNTVTVVSEARTIPVVGGQFTDTFAAEYSHHVYKVAL